MVDQNRIFQTASACDTVKVIATTYVQAFWSLQAHITCTVTEAVKTSAALVGSHMHQCTHIEPL